MLVFSINFSYQTSSILHKKMFKLPLIDKKTDILYLS